MFGRKRDPKFEGNDRLDSWKEQVISKAKSLWKKKFVKWGVFLLVISCFYGLGASKNGDEKKDEAPVLIGEEKMASSKVSVVDSTPMSSDSISEINSREESSEVVSSQEIAEASLRSSDALPSSLSEEKVEVQKTVGRPAASSPAPKTSVTTSPVPAAPAPVPVVVSSELPPKAEVQEEEEETVSVEVRGNRKSKIYHMPGDQSYEKMANSKNLVIFHSPEEAEEAGYRRAKR